MNCNTFTHVVANVLLVAVVICLMGVMVGWSDVNVFDREDRQSPVYKGQMQDAVSLMVNVYWGNEYIDGFLEIFRKYDVKVTFFVGGYWASRYPDVLAKIYAGGHEIGNHGYFHKEQGKLDYEKNYSEICTCGKVILDCIGVPTTLFAPPGGDYNKETLKAASALNHRTIMWTRDTIDWRDKDSNLVLRRATQDICGGELILMHPTKHTLQALENIVKYYQKNNIKIVTVSRNIGAV